MITTLSGPNSFMLRHELHRLVDAFVAEHGDMALERVDGEEADYQRMVEAVQGLPFLAPKKMIVLTRPGAQKQFADKFAELLETIPGTNDVIIVEPKPDKRSSYFKQLKNKTDLKEFGELDMRALASWLVTAVKEAGGSMTQNDAQHLVERVGANQQLLYMELQKLLTYDPSITRQSIDELTETTPQSTVFQLLDAAFAGNKKRLLQLYQEQRALMVEPMEILSMLAWQLHVLAVVSTAEGRAPNVIAKEAGINPYVVQKTAAVARKLSVNDVRRLIYELHKLDTRLKSEPIDADEALQYYLLNINGK